jgi:hypothetical protein
MVSRNDSGCCRPVRAETNGVSIPVCNCDDSAIGGGVNGVMLHVVLVLVVVSVALGNRDNLGNAERNEKTFFHLFLRNAKNPIFY